jgi:tetratricopeptide (TPR) repeat protein
MDELIERCKRDLQSNTPFDVEALFETLAVSGASDARVFMEFAPLFQQAGDDRSAARCYEAAIAAAPTLQPAYYRLSKIHLDAQRPQRAIKVLREGILACRQHASERDVENLVRDYAALSCVDTDADMVDWESVLRQEPVAGRAIPDAIRVTMVKDEADIIYFSLRSSYLAGIRNYVVADNASHDATKSEIQRFAADHPDCNVLIVDDLIVAYYQAEKTNALMQLGVKYFSMSGQPVRWVFVIDGDEYFYFLNPAYDLKKILEAAEEKQAEMLVFMWSTASPAYLYSDLPKDYDLRQVFSVISGFRFAAITKVAVRYSPQVHIEMGSHFASKCTDDIEKIMLMPEYGAMMMHSPMRSVAQAYKKILNGGKALQAATKLNAAQGAHWRTQFDAYKADGVEALRKNLLNFITTNKQRANWIRMRVR